MEKQETMTYQKAFAGGVVKKGDYFSVQYPDGRNVLFRLVKREGKYVMWGMTTTKQIYLEGKKGYDNFLTWADAKVREEYSSEDTFEEVHALGLSDKDYEIHSQEEFRRILDEAEKMCGSPEDANMYYALASRCVNVASIYAYFGVLRVYSGDVGAYSLYYSNGYSYSYPFAVRPEATPKSTLLLKLARCNGSKEKPWICLNSQEDVQEVNTSNDDTAGEDMADMSKAELVYLIQEGQELIQKQCAWLTKLEKYAQNLK